MIKYFFTIVLLTVTLSTMSNEAKLTKKVPELPNWKDKFDSCGSFHLVIISSVIGLYLFKRLINRKRLVENYDHEYHVALGKAELADFEKNHKPSAAIYIGRRKKIFGFLIFVLISTLLCTLSLWISIRTGLVKTHTEAWQYSGEETRTVPRGWIMTTYTKTQIPNLLSDLLLLMMFSCIGMVMVLVYKFISLFGINCYEITIIQKIKDGDDDDDDDCDIVVKDDANPTDI